MADRMSRPLGRLIYEAVSRSIRLDARRKGVSLSGVSFTGVDIIFCRRTAFLTDPASKPERLC